MADVTKLNSNNFSSYEEVGNPHNKKREKWNFDI